MGTRFTLPKTWPVEIAKLAAVYGVLVLYDTPDLLPELEETDTAGEETEKTPNRAALAQV